MSLESRPSDIAGRALFTTADTSTGSTVLEMDDDVGSLDHSGDPDVD